VAAERTGATVAPARSYVRRLVSILGVALAGFLVGVLALGLFVTLSGPELAIWHTTTLNAEFYAARADIRDFGDYLRLEEELLAELDERIYLRTESGPEQALARYSADSLADPRGRTPDWNRSFELVADDPVGGVLLLHGMSDSPYSLRAFGEELHRQGYTVLGLRLPGHGTVPSGIAAVSWEDMAAAVDLAMGHLGASVGPRPLHVIGYSTGAALAVDYALEASDAGRPAPASLVLVSPSIGISPAAALAVWTRRLSVLPGLERLAWTAIQPEFDPYKYNSFTTNAAEQVHRLTRGIARKIEARAARGGLEAFPRTLVLLSTVDATVSVEAVIDDLLEHLPVARGELVLFDLNRSSLNSSVLVADPGPLTARLLSESSLPFGLTLVGNESTSSRTVVSRRKPAVSGVVSVEPLGLQWPPGVFSLSHVALPFPPDDPLYGRRDAAPVGELHLGEMAARGERGLLRFPADWLLRLRHNPFYDFVEARVVDWVRDGG
jgi:esterase/lipase